jgi:ABC-2 type transport system permease protein
MSVFRGNMILLKRSAGIGLMYLCIFILITVIVQVAGQNEEETLSFDVVSSRVGVVDLDQSRISKGLVEYLRENNQVITYENNKEVLMEAIYYEDVYAVVVIPKGFAEDCLEGKGIVDITKAPNSTSVLYVDMDINKYIFQIQALKAASFTDEEVIKYAVSNAKVESGVELVESGNERITTAPYNFYFRYSPYVYLSVLIYMLGNILIPKNQKDMSQRLT